MRKAILVTTIALTGCMSPSDPDARTHCLIPAMCLDIAANRGNGPGFWGSDPALTATMLLMSAQVNASTQGALSALGNNLAVIGSHNVPVTPLQVRIVP